VRARYLQKIRFVSVLLYTREKQQENKPPAVEEQKTEHNRVSTGLERSPCAGEGGVAAGEEGNSEGAHDHLPAGFPVQTHEHAAVNHQPLAARRLSGRALQGLLGAAAVRVVDLLAGCGAPCTRQLPAQRGCVVMMCCDVPSSTEPGYTAHDSDLGASWGRVCFTSKL
jgi:hypothetical protein